MPRLGSVATGAVALAYAVGGCASAPRTAAQDVVVLAAPSSTAASSSIPSAAPSGHTCPPRTTPTPDAHGAIRGVMVVIDCVDAVAFGGHNYTTRNNTPIEPTRLDQIVGHVQCTLAGNPSIDPSYRMRDGDATFLPQGAALYTVKGVPPSQAIAAEHDGVTLLYRVDAAG